MNSMNMSRTQSTDLFEELKLEGDQIKVTYGNSISYISGKLLFITGGIQGNEIGATLKNENISNSIYKIDLEEDKQQCQ